MDGDRRRAFVGDPSIRSIESNLPTSLGSRLPGRRPRPDVAIGPAERDQWLACMDRALERIGASEELKDMLREPMFRVADTVRNQDHSGPKQRHPDIIAVG